MKEFVSSVCNGACQVNYSSQSPENYTTTPMPKFDYLSNISGNYLAYLTTAKSETQKYQEKFDDERKANRDYYESKPLLDVTTSNTYTDGSAWAHTIPEEGIINIRPPESLDADLSVFNHEVVHNFYPHMRNEYYISLIGKGPMAKYIVNSFRYSRH
ncbi:MAG: hypothetical protein NT120_04990 [Candidatus Aenigmarchaeota archaeon]|nr:hypothetical protein [Candidatus Aenigmarchaeota archaeon]